MGLKDLNLPEKVIKTSGGDLAVRGLSLDDLTRLTRGHLQTMQDLFSYVKFTAEGQVSVGIGESVGLALLDMAPDFAAEVIALAAGDGDSESVSIAKSLALSVQIEVLEAIGELTFVSEGGAKKVVETVIRIMQGIAAPLGVARKT